LRANGLVVAGYQTLGAGLTVTGETRIIGAQIGRNLDCQAATLSNPSGPALDLTRTSVAGTLVFAPGKVTGSVRLCETRVNRLDDRLAAWPAGQVAMAGLRYETLGTLDGPEATVRQRLDWLDGPYEPQPYEQLAAYYRRTGRDHDARSVAIAKQRRRRRQLPWWQRPWGYFLDWTVGYGYRPWLALVWLLVLLAIGTSLFDTLHRNGALVPRGGSGAAPVFTPALYTLDLLLPVVNLKQRDFWVSAETSAQAAAAVFIVLGWVIASAAVAALTGLLKRE
jgi:hypothetical protein